MAEVSGSTPTKLTLCLACLHLSLSGWTEMKCSAVLSLPHSHQHTGEFNVDTLPLLDRAIY
jgi:hypothetical protein